MRFQNPAYELSVPDAKTPTNTLLPGQHEYANPVTINTQDMQTAANVILQKAKQNPFVMADSHNDAEVIDFDSKKQLINI